MTSIICVTNNTVLIVAGAVSHTEMSLLHLGDRLWAQLRTESTLLAVNSTAHKGFNYFITLGLMKSAVRSSGTSTFSFSIAQWARDQTTISKKQSMTCPGQVIFERYLS